MPKQQRLTEFRIDRSQLNPRVIDSGEMILTQDTPLTHFSELTSTTNKVYYGIGSHRVYLKGDPEHRERNRELAQTFANMRFQT